MFVKTGLLTGLVLAIALGFGAVAQSNADANGPFSGTFRVTIENLSTGQPLSPPVAATHRPGLRLFKVGAYASPEIEAIAEAGNELAAFDLLNASPKVTEVVDIGAPLTPYGTVVGDFTDTATFDITGRAGDRLSLATMLICTNDGFTGLDGVRLPREGSVVFETNAYDAGTEDNTQNSPDIVDPCSALGPVHLDGDDNGNEDAAVDTNPAQGIHMHPGIHGSGDLDPAVHGWYNPVVRVTVERIG